MEIEKFQSLVDKYLSGHTTAEEDAAPNKSHLIPWRDNELYFNGKTLREIGVILERMYNVNVCFEDDSIMEYSYTGLVRNSSLNNVLDLITATSPVEVQMYSNTIKFSKRRTK